MKKIILPMIKDSLSDYKAAEEEILRAYQREIYFPLLKIFDVRRKTITNARKGSALIEAIRDGRVRFRLGSGEFYGKFNAAISRELKEMGAVWYGDGKVWRIWLTSIPPHIQDIIRTSEVVLQRRLDLMDKSLRQIVPEVFADKIKLSEIFEKTIRKVDAKVDDTLKHIAVPPTITLDDTAIIARDWANNMALDIKTFTDKQVKELRKRVLNHVVAGGRYEDIIDDIKNSYGVTKRKARFWARQETSLLMAKVKQARYQAAGVNEYIWTCVAGSPAHPVRPAHKRLDGSTQRFDDPPITTEPGEPERRNNPGEDYNCRCGARPVIKI